MCRVGQRCASHGAEQLEKATDALTSATHNLESARGKSDKDINLLQMKVVESQKSVDKAQHHYDSTKTGMKSLRDQGYDSDDTRMKRANLQNVFGKTVLDRKKSTGSYYPSRATITL